MSKWEYKLLLEKYAYIWKDDGHTHKDWKVEAGKNDYQAYVTGLYIVTYLKQLGEEGWELVSTVFRPAGWGGDTHIRHYLKRPIE